MAKVNFDSPEVQQFIKIYSNYLNSLPEYEYIQLMERIRQAHLNNMPIQTRDRIAEALSNSGNLQFIKNFTAMAIFNLGCKGDSITLELPPHLIDIFNDTFKLNGMKGNHSVEQDLFDSQNKISEKVNQLQAIKNQSMFGESTQTSSQSSISSANNLLPKNWTKDDLRRSFLMSEIIRLPRCKRKKIK